MKLSKLKQAAIAYSQHGFSVIPMTPEKTPYIKFANTDALSPSEVSRLWDKFPNANIGLRTTFFFVVDIDRDHKAGGDGVKSLTEAFGNETWLKEWFENTLCEQSAHGGFHFFFKKPEENDLRQDIGLLPAVDVKAHINNYAVVAPSKLADGSYKWLNHNPIKPAPSYLLNLLRQKQAAKKQKPLFTTDYSFTGRPTGAAKWFSMVASGLGAEGKTGQNPYGGRNNALTKMVGALIGYYNLPAEQVGILANYANANTPQPLPTRDVEATVNSVIRDELRRKAVTE